MRDAAKKTVHALAPRALTNYGAEDAQAGRGNAPREISESLSCLSPSYLRRQPWPDSSFEMGFPHFPIWQPIENKLVIFGLRGRGGRKEFPKWCSSFNAKITTILIYK
jgi:hypothetical protein